MDEKTFVEAMRLLEELRAAINEAGERIDEYKNNSIRAGHPIPFQIEKKLTPA